ncbi:Lrp/AsnC family transcriptional regulator [Peterkaempfera bronchialis]|uniref:Lrp/AsnC family transcriptional regulator n=1 Tax=Peterkaempfera bronchialis TaxID=2126346 RepID=UPI001E5D8F68|nr:Lrp/AsnC family transcriptional regulator [Peterkaempfera bronchialis]
MPNELHRELAPVDRAILRVLRDNARTPNKAVAEAVGIAPSTCLTRIRSLCERGVIRGFHTDVDPRALGLGVQAMIAVRLHSHAPRHVDAFVRGAPDLPGVLAVFHVSGPDDYLLHVAAPDTVALRDFVLEHLTAHPAVQQARTSLIFGQVRGAAAAAGSGSAAGAAAAAE